MQLFQALSEALNNHLRLVSSEKKGLIDEAKKIATATRQMELSMSDSKQRRKNSNEGSMKVSYPLMQCLQTLKKKHDEVQRVHSERVVQVQSESMLDLNQGGLNSY